MRRRGPGLNAAPLGEYKERVARAGFWAVSSGAISFRHDGRWYSDDEPINNARIASLFSRCLRQTDDGRWQIAMADERAFVTIEDTPWVVTGVERDGSGGFRLRLNDGSEEPLDPASLETDGERIVCRLRGALPARFGRVAMQQLAPFVVEHAGDAALLLDGRRVPLRAVPAAPRR